MPVRAKFVVMSLLAMMCAFILFACNGNDSSGSSDPPSIGFHYPIVPSYSISGTVSGAIVEGVTVYRKDALYQKNAAFTGSITTDVNGNYSVGNSQANRRYILAPVMEGYVFSPNSVAVSVAEADVAGIDFIAEASSAPTYNLSGKISGPYVEYVLVSISGAGNGTTFTDADGNFSFSNLPAGTYTVTPSLAGYTFTPDSPTIDLNGDSTQDFTAVSTIPSYSVSGTVSATTTKTGRINIWAFSANGSNNIPQAGTSIDSAGAYTIRGLRPGSYTVQAEMDSLYTGDRNANNPAGVSDQVDIVDADASGIDVTLADPVPPDPETPTELEVFPGDATAFIQWHIPQDASDTEIATSYRIYWGTDTAANNGTPILINAHRESNFLQSGLVNGTGYYYKISAVAGSKESPVSAVVGPVTIGATTGANTVSGTFTFGTSFGPLLIVLSRHTYGGDFLYFTRITNPKSPQHYTLSGVSDGDYYTTAVFDSNRNGTLDIDDIGYHPNSLDVMVVNGDITGNNLDLPSTEISAKVSTAHSISGPTDAYRLNLGISTPRSKPAKVTLVSGNQLPVPFDIPNRNGAFYLQPQLVPTRPKVGDTYVFKVTYANGYTGTLYGSIKAVFDSPPLNLAVQTTTPGSPYIPLLTWDPPASLSATPYRYAVNLSGTDTSWFSQYTIPVSTTSVLYNSNGNALKSTLTPGVTYDWIVTLSDADRNYVTTSSDYTP